jgi:hypothetical protein
MSEDFDKISPEAARLIAARKAAAEELKGIDGAERPITDHFVCRLASARLYEQSVLARVLAGEPITSSEFKAASDMVEAARANVPRQIGVEIEFVEGPVEHCPKCGWHRGEPTAPPKLIEGTAEELKSSSPTVSAEKRTSDAPNGSALPSKALPKPSPKWIGEGDKAFMPAVDHSKGNEGWFKRSAWSGSAPKLGPHGGAVRRNGPSPGEHGFMDRSLPVTPAGEYGK